MNPKWPEIARQVNEAHEEAKRAPKLSKAQQQALKEIHDEVFGPVPTRPPFDFSHWRRMELWPLEDAVYVVLEDYKPNRIGPGTRFTHLDKGYPVERLYTEALASVHAGGLVSIAFDTVAQHCRASNGIRVGVLDRFRFGG